jgi:hypothetical protein
MSENTLAGDDTDTSLNTNQATEKTYTQKEVDDMMARTKSAVQKRVASKYEDLGDPEELRQLKADYEQRKLEEQKKRGEFDSIIAKIDTIKNIPQSSNIPSTQKKIIIEGVIKDFTTAEPLSFATISFSHSSKGTRANIDGKFTFISNEGNLDTMIISSIG